MRVVILGNGAQAKYALECWRLTRQYEIIGLIAIGEDEVTDWSSSYDCPIYKGLEKLLEITEAKMDGFLVCVAEPLRKQELHEYAVSLSLLPVSACHPGAYIAQTANVAAGAIINAGAVIQPFASIGTGVMIHANAVVEHDCVLGDYVNLAPGVSLAGWVSVGDGTKIYTGATVIPQVRIGKYATIAAGATVIENVPDRALVAGVPGVIKYISE